MPYGDDNTEEQRQYNAEKAMDVWTLLADAGFAPFCPHLSHFIHERAPRPRMHWLAQTASWVDVCDCLLQLGETEGVIQERNRALAMGKPVFQTIGALADAYGMEV